MNKYVSMTDDELVSRYANGENEAFASLLNRHNKRIFSYILFYVKDEDVANDIFQDTFFRAITVIRQHRYSANDKFFSFLCRVAHNLIIDYFRARKSENQVGEECLDYANVLQQADLQDANVEDKLVASQILKDVKKLMNELPDSQREIVRMRFYENLSFKEIAELTNISINTALGRMRYAIMNMRRMAEENHLALEV
ncbi:MAG: sigma-70 family RNA polymerase sigma factor [Paludibacteraceae bacterium]|jgi:RNA polymerase sigma-70 factor (ECF subfamily)|nr:sigma-70 family RNA polymerase sigma factor [Paludibacteraceae bacterium]MBQ2052023.1 sigma-70 family RNA polymerase sigma factor [Paludibacteraceae bacterium]MBQ3895759.1 sigma-70 family RNA polymerase sigma factor [Paludibacteraceae bacterium]MBR2178711.1 sigma-70 family RNA polymerase sigma factor [Paludibacteraceae bacterium]MCM8872044.1 sigma-70 family RNA polymerase sigma factor [Paludibacteraceae bacterium]